MWMDGPVGDLFLIVFNLNHMGLILWSSLPLSRHDLSLFCSGPRVGIRGLLITLTQNAMVVSWCKAGSDRVEQSCFHREWGYFVTYSPHVPQWKHTVSTSMKTGMDNTLVEFELLLWTVNLLNYYIFVYYKISLNHDLMCYAFKQLNYCRTLLWLHSKLSIYVCVIWDLKTITS